MASPRLSYPSLLPVPELFHFWKRAKQWCDVTAWWLEISSSGFEWAWKSVVFLVFPAVFARLFVTQQRRRNGRTLVHKVMKNGFEILDKVKFSFDLRVNVRSILRAIVIFTWEYRS